MQRGKVKFWQDDKGYGFLNTEGVEKDIFVHFSKIEMTGRRTLQTGQEVEFEYQEGPKGLNATRVVPLVTE